MVKDAKIKCCKPFRAKSLRPSIKCPTNLMYRELLSCMGIIHFVVHYKVSTTRALMMVTVHNPSLLASCTLVFEPAPLSNVQDTALEKELPK